MRLFKLECKRLFSGAINKFMLFLFVFSGVFAIYQGAQGYKSVRIDQYKSKIVFQKEREHVIGREKIPEAGSLAYYAYAPTEWKLSPWAALFSGQSHSAMVALKVSALALQGQIYNREIVNPLQQRTGGMDLGFVMVYLLPLVIGMLTVTLVSDEQHAGRWRLTSALPQGGFRLLRQQLLLRFGVLWLLCVLLLVSAALLLKLPFDGQFALVLAAISLYMLFWFAVAGLIMSFGKSSVVNSLTYTSIWVVFAILLPGAVHLYLSHQFQTDAPLQASLKQRMVLNDGWDQDKQAALNTFLSQNPTWQETAPLGEAFDWKWYYAQQHLSDVSASQYWQQHQELSLARNQRLQQLSVLSPCLFLQLKLNQLAKTSSEDHLAYLAQVSEYHQKIRHFFYDFLFFDREFTADDVNAFPLFEAKKPNTEIGILWFIISGIVVIALAGFSGHRLKKVGVSA